MTEDSDVMSAKAQVIGVEQGLITSLRLVALPGAGGGRDASHGEAGEKEHAPAEIHTVAAGGSQRCEV